MADLLEKIRGGLYGQAMGDAFAMPALLSPQETWDHFGGWITDFLAGPDNHPVHFGLPAGKVTDDTEQAIALAEEFINDGKVTPEGTARAVLKWYARIGGDNSPYVGPSTQRAVTALKAGEDIYQTGSRGDTNGCAMRVSPIGLIHPGDVEGAVIDAYNSCIPTHHTDVAISGAAAIAGAIAEAMRGEVSVQSIVEAACQSADIGRRLGFRWLGASVSRRIRMAVEIARSSQGERERLQEIFDVVGTSLATQESVPAALGVLCMAEGDPYQTAIYSAALSGDADTIGAMACAIAGAWRGISAFRPAHIEKLNQANPEFNFEKVAQGLLALAEKNINEKGK